MARRRSFNTGVRGRNWVRAYEDRGRFYLEWLEAMTDPDTGQPVRDGKGRRKYRRPRVLVRSERWADACQRAIRLSEQFAARASQRTVTLDSMLTLYLKEVTPGKGESKQGHDRRAARVWRSFFGAQTDEKRRLTRHPDSLDRLDWDRFCTARRTGQIEGWGRVRDRQVQYDLKFMVAVLNWSTGAGLIERNPWNAETRRTQRWEMPREKNPKRPGMTGSIREKLIAHSPHWQFALALVLQRETRRRNSAVRRLWWSDVDLEAGTVRWRGELDKAGLESVTPLTAAAVQALRGAKGRGIGDTPVFPSAKTPGQPTPRNTWQVWLRRAKQRAGIRIRGLGYHGEKRAGVRDPKFRALPPAIQEYLAGTRWETLAKVYDQVDVEDVRAAMQAEGM